MANDKKELLSIETMHGTFKTERYTPTYERRKAWVPDDPKKLISFIPGTILEIDVKEGDKVSIGDRLLMFKAMKMNNTVKSDIDGTIKKIHVAIGDIIPKGVLILEFE